MEKVENMNACMYYKKTTVSLKWYTYGYSVFLVKGINKTKTSSAKWQVVHFKQLKEIQRCMCYF